MPGFSLTLLLLPGVNEQSALSTDFLLSLLDDPTNTPGWNWSSKVLPTHARETPQSTSTSTLVTGLPSVKLRAPVVGLFDGAAERACKELITAEPEITKMDSIAGDGDCGLTLKDGATGLPLSKLIFYDIDAVSRGAQGSRSRKCDRRRHRREHDHDLQDR